MLSCIAASSVKALGIPPSTDGGSIQMWNVEVEDENRGWRIAGWSMYALLRSQI